MRESMMGHTPAPQLLPLVLYSLLRDPTPLYLRGLRGPHNKFVIIFWTSFCNAILVDFGSNLASTCLPTRIQNRPKIDPRAIQTPSQLASCFRSPFGWIFERILIDCRLPNRPKSIKIQSNSQPNITTTKKQKS